ncbi:MAG: putative sigma regulatory factor [Chlamydiota bacterium]|jgi:anti-anti-sigma factor
MRPGLHIHLEQIENRVVLRLEGRMDAGNCPTLGKKIESLLNEGHQQLLIDFAKIDYLSSAGLRVILSAAKRLKAKEGYLLLFSLSVEAEEVIKMAGFDKLLYIVPNEKEALQFRL